MKKSWFTVQALADGRTAQVAVRGYIGEWGVTDRDFIAAVEAFGEVDTIEVAINSRGGEVDHALSIFNFLKNHSAKVNMRVDGVAMSAASIILMAGDSIEMPANAILMVHQPSTFASGNAADLRQAAGMLDTFETALLETYLARTGKTAEALKALLDDETFMTAKEAVANGFADRVIPLNAEARATSAMAYASAFDIPLDVLARAQAEALADDVQPAPAGFTLINEAGTMAWAAPAGVTQETCDKIGKAAMMMNAAVAAAFLSANGYTSVADGSPSTGSGRTDEEDVKPLPESLSAQIATAAASAGLADFLPCFALDATLTDAHTVRQAMADAREVFDLCNLVGQAEQAAPLIKQRATLAEARKALQARMAEADEASHTDSTLNHSQSGGQQAAAAGAPAVSTSSIWDARRKAGARS